MTDATAARFESADIPTLRRALLADADVHEQRASGYASANTGTELAAWTGLLLAGSHNRLAAALLGLLGDPRVPADIAERGRCLVGQVLAGWPEVLEDANDDLDDVPETPEQISGQGALPVGERARIVLSNEGFDYVAAALERPAKPVPELVDLFSRPRVVPAANEGGAYETDTDPEPKIGDHGTCSAPVGRGAEGTAPCGYEIVLREERTALMADGTDGHGQPGGQLVLAWRHVEHGIDHHHRAQLGGPA